MRLGRQSVAELVDAIAERTPAPASGAAAAVTGALAAALVELAAQIADDAAAAAEARSLSTRLLELADADGAAYTAFLAERTPEHRAEIVRIPAEIATAAERAVELARGVRERLSRTVGADADAASALAGAAAAVARALVDVNSS
jgi:methenyltetrahydrofolate cyclohydrolase